MNQKVKLLSIPLVVVMVLLGFTLIHSFPRSSTSLSNPVPVQIQYSSGLSLYLVGQSDLQDMLINLGVPWDDIHTTSVNGLQVMTGNLITYQFPIFEYLYDSCDIYPMM
jgi:hypothetical protein